MPKKFSDFNLPPENTSYVGDKIPIKRLIGKEITILEYKIGLSTKQEGEKCLTLQIEKDGEKRVCFTGGKYLMQQIEKVNKDDFPFTTTIRQDKEYYEFT